MARKSKYDEELDQVIDKVTQAKREAAQREQNIQRQISRLSMQVEQLDEEEGVMREILARGPAGKGEPPAALAELPEDDDGAPSANGGPAPMAAAPAAGSSNPAAAVAAPAPADSKVAAAAPPSDTRAAGPAAGPPPAEPRTPAAGITPAVGTPNPGAVAAVQALPPPSSGEVPDEEGDELEFDDKGGRKTGTLPEPAKPKPSE